MKWTVTGADRDTGVDRSIEIDAFNGEEAKQIATIRGLLVSDAHPADQPKAKPITPDYASPTTPPPSSTSPATGIGNSPPHPLSVPRRQGEYPGLVFAAAILRIAAILQYILSGICLFGIAASFGGQVPVSMTPVSFFVGAICALVTGATLHGLSGLCEAVNDIAMNSFGKGFRKS